MKGVEKTNVFQNGDFSLTIEANLILIKISRFCNFLKNLESSQCLYLFSLTLIKKTNSTVHALISLFSDFKIINLKYLRIV
jgi:hypothetical protein